MLKTTQQSHARLLTVSLLTLALTGAACSGAGSNVREPRHREYKPPVDFKNAKYVPEDGSLYNEASLLSNYFVDQRAYRAGDIVTILISEKSSAAGSAGTELSKSSDFDAKIEVLFTLMDRIGDTSPSLENGQLVQAATDYAFKGEGSTKREGSLKATVTAHVRDVLPNGNLFIEGTKTILVNSEEQYFYISGVIRPVDVLENNTISSDLISEAQVEFSGQGVITDVSEPGWFARMFGWLWPF
ncbi:MAG: flagellar biosynthesis protein FlgH [Myxococcales bacterium]|nr:flagellar biosynthesis protein FlgH [Myxococcales bacterium]